MRIRNDLRCLQCTLALIVVLLSTLSHAERPRIGLALGGGGARGAAHIGVLRELERHRVPIDAIAGTSMGAIVGGLYAAGMSTDELEEVVATLDWVDALSDSASRKDLSFRRKQDDAQYPINFELGIRDSELLLPMGVIAGQKLDLILRELTLGVSHVADFDDLPIPFRAIATDIERGEAYVMGEGDLAKAIRASMSVPGVFAPLRIGDRLLVDGGIVGNMPIDVVRQMDVDIVIAVDVEFPLYTADELTSALTISEQMLTILIRKETLRQIDSLAENDILIRPELGTFASSDFAQIAQTVEPGVRATAAETQRLEKLSVTEREFADYLARRAIKPDPRGKLAFVRVAHDRRVSPAILASRLQVEAGDPIDSERLAADAERLFGLGLYEQVSYQLIEENGATGVEFLARAKSWGPNILQFAVSLENDFEGATAFNLGTRLTMTGLNPHGGEWQTDLQLGTDPALLSELYQPFGNASQFFVAPRIDLRQYNINAFVADSAIARYRISETELGLDLGAEIKSFGEFRIGAYYGTGRGKVKVGDPLIPNVEFDTGGVLGRLRFDTRDDSRFPRRGIRADLSWRQSLPGLGADERFNSLQSEIDATWSRGKNSLQLGLSYATTVSAEDSIENFFPLGGFLRLSGLERGEISGPHAALARLVYYRRVGESAGGLFDVPVYLGVSAEAGNAWESRSDIRFDTAHFNGSVFAGLDTIIGPVYLAAGFAEGGRSNVYLFFGAPPR
ncbi:MAG: patatin-like phospholipase family protein [Gammaproteobacteria bacterium]|nr:patatin-like phospholipase family protein [Gammaproteobacteria bacterium]MDH3373958.1 patatin-like phospholipase family protein [Gammaproteobacteria bacterium]MDH3409679.1 patatin-like phospholipase family protein [Gammaproteobacteria bacterium]